MRNMSIFFVCAATPNAKSTAFVAVAVDDLTWCCGCCCLFVAENKKKKHNKNFV